MIPIQPVQQWEYASDVFYVYGNDIGSWLNGWGDQGWELVSAHFHSSISSYAEEHYQLIFKRPKQNQ